ncbi:MAG: hypothetical protein AAFR95_04890, partial [Bacteroidota bacterium]
MATAPALVAFASLSSLLSTLASAPALVLLALIFLAALGVALVLTPTFRTAAFRFGWVDIPDARKIHTVPVPRVGGIAIFAGLTAGLALAYLVQDGLPFDIPP